MKKILCTSEAAEELFRDENANWSRAGAYALVSYLEELEEATDSPIEFDRVAIRCDYAEWESLQEWAADYFSGDWKEELGCKESDCIDDWDNAIRDYIRDHGTLIEFDGGIIVSSF